MSSSSAASSSSAPSSSAASSSSSSSAHDERTTSAFELRILTLDDLMTERINHAVRDDGVSAAYLRHYNYIARTLARLESELDQAQEEESIIFNHLMASSDFRHTISPVIRTFRRRLQRQGFQPYIRNNRLLEPRHTAHPLPSMTPSQSSSRSSTKKPSFGSSQLQSDTHTQHGSELNPINIDTWDGLDRDDWFKATEEEMLQSLRHDTGPKRFKPTCERCGQWGHEKPDCDTRLRSFSVCDTCKWLKRRQRDCDHYDLSPVDCRELRGKKIPYDDED